MPFENLEILNYVYLGNSVYDYLFVLSIFVISAIVLKIFKVVIIKKLKNVSAKTKTDIDDLILKIVDDIRWPFFVLVSIFIAIQFIIVPDLVRNVFFYVLLVGGIYYAIKGLQDVIDYGSNKIIQQRQKEEQDVDTSVIDLLSRILKISLWALGLLFFISNLGFNITPLVAGLGIGGVAIAFALQHVLTDIFASFSIYFDKPFQKGDFIIIGNDMGVVERIGIKSTRIKTLQGQELIVSNKELTETRINNYKKMDKRRVVFTFGVKYETPNEKLEKVPVIVSNIVNRNELAKIDRVHFNKFGDFSLNFEVVYYIDTSDYNKYMDIQQQVNLALKGQFEKEGIEFAYPTQTVFLNKKD